MPRLLAQGPVWYCFARRNKRIQHEANFRTLELASPAAAWWKRAMKNRRNGYIYKTEKHLQRYGDASNMWAIFQTIVHLCLTQCCQTISWISLGCSRYLEIPELTILSNTLLIAGRKIKQNELFAYSILICTSQLVNSNTVNFDYVISCSKRVESLLTVK